MTRTRTTLLSSRRYRTDTLHFVASLKHKTFVAKLGGSSLTYQRAVLQALVWLHGLRVEVVLVTPEGHQSARGYRN